MAKKLHEVSQGKERLKRLLAVRPFQEDLILFTKDISNSWKSSIVSCRRWDLKFLEVKRGITVKDLLYIPSIRMFSVLIQRKR